MVANEMCEAFYNLITRERILVELIKREELRFSSKIELKLCMRFFYLQRETRPKF